MKYNRKPENFEKIHKNYLVVGYFREKAIIKDELKHLYFIRCEENFAPIGTIADKELLEPVAKLCKEEQESIQEIYGNH